MSGNRPVAVIDVGSNSIKLLVARLLTEKNTLETLFSETIETRISTGISRELPSLTEASIEAGSKTIEELVRLAQAYQPQKIEIVATSAVRDAINGMDLIEKVRELTGIGIKVLSGQKEAQYVCRGLACDPEVKGIDPFIQLDLGGGSLELIHYEKGEIKDALSLQLGADRLSERFIKDAEAPFDPKIENAIRVETENVLTQCGLSFAPANGPFLATGGAFVITRAILAARNGKSIEDRSPNISLDEIRTLKSELMSLPLHERMSVPHLPAARADILPTALITIEAVLKHAQRNLVKHSFYNLRYGIASENLQRNQ
jgi:exopolyphosphatase/guanosine-5'-triphosphate,3'-diphosphate pyrophosphatase